MPWEVAVGLLIVGFGLVGLAALPVLYLIDITVRECRRWRRL